jgi:hypothetical protein
MQSGLLWKDAGESLSDYRFASNNDPFVLTK